MPAYRKNLIHAIYFFAYRKRLWYNVPIHTFKEVIRVSPKKKRLTPIWLMVLIDLIVFIVALLVFALFHHVIPQEMEAVGTVSQRVSANITAGPSATALPEVSPTPTVEPTEIVQSAATLSPMATAEPTPTPTPDPVGYFGTKFADKFTDGEIISNKDGYQSQYVNITLTPYDENGVEFYVADIYVKDISYLQTGLAKDTYGSGYSEWPAKLCERLGGIIAINGDYYGARKDGTIIRNGVLYRTDAYPDRDTCVLFWDGTMETYSKIKLDVDGLMERGAYQSWCFGPALLDDEGNPKTKFNSDVTGRNPRTAIGYFEPGHYCFVVADGRSKSSKGLTMSELSTLMYNLGCKVAYNLDGGQTSQMVVGDDVVNDPYKDGRKCSDIIMIAEPQQ